MGMSCKGGLISSHSHKSYAFIFSTPFHLYMSYDLVIQIYITLNCIIMFHSQGGAAVAVCISPEMFGGADVTLHP